jgi:dolichyl-phosphate beta-glucosyltransferase
MRKIASKLYITVLCVLGGFKLSDSQCGCKAFRNHAAKKIFSNATVDRFAFDFEALLIANKIGYRIAEYPVKVINHGDSKVNVLKDSLKMLSDLYKMKVRIKNTELK